MRTRAGRWMAGFSAALLLSAATAKGQEGQGGPWRIQTAQSGVATSALQAGQPFDVIGSGFHAAVLPIKVCVDGRGCQLATADKDGSFLVSRSFASPGVYMVEAWQARDMKVSEWRLKASMQVAVHN